MEGFKNIKRAQVHSLGTKAMMACSMNIHENVPGFDEACKAGLLCLCFGITTNRPWLFEQGQLKSSGQKIEKVRPTPQWYYADATSLWEKSLCLILMESVLRLTPQMFGFPCRRDRVYRITWDPKRMAWSLATWCKAFLEVKQPLVSERLNISIASSLRCLPCFKLRIFPSSKLQSWCCFPRTAIVMSKLSTCWSLQSLTLQWSKKISCQGKQFVIFWYVFVRSWTFHDSWFMDSSSPCAGHKRYTWIATGTCVRTNASTLWHKTQRGWNELKIKTLNCWPSPHRWISGNSVAFIVEFEFDSDCHVFLVNQPVQNPLQNIGQRTRSGWWHRKSCFCPWAFRALAQSVARSPKTQLVIWDCCLLVER